MSIPAAASAIGGAAYAASRPDAAPDAFWGPARGSPVRAEAVIDTDAIAANTRRCCAGCAAATRRQPDGRRQGRRLRPRRGRAAAGRAAGGADALGVATPTEALNSARPVSTRRCSPGSGRPARTSGRRVAAGVDRGLASRTWTRCWPPARRPAEVHLKIDTGLGRNGVGPAALGAYWRRWPLRRQSGRVEVAGLMSHLASADVPGDPRSPSRPRRSGTRCGAADRRRNPAATAAPGEHPGRRSTIPDTYFDLVRCGIGSTGSTRSPTPAGLQPGDDAARHRRADQAGAGRIRASPTA